LIAEGAAVNVDRIAAIVCLATTFVAPALIAQAVPASSKVPGRDLGIPFEALLAR